MLIDNFLPEDTKVIPDSGVIATAELDGGIVLLHLQTSQYYSLNGTGAQIWQGIQTQQNVGELNRRLVDRYAITPAEASVAVNILLAELRAETLIQVEP